MTIKSLNLIIRDATNNGKAALNEKAPTDQHNDEDYVNESTKVVLMRKIMQLLLLMISIISYVVKVAIRNIDAKKYVNKKWCVV